MLSIPRPIENFKISAQKAYDNHPQLPLGKYFVFARESVSLWKKHPEYSFEIASILFSLTTHTDVWEFHPTIAEIYDHLMQLDLPAEHMRTDDGYNGPVERWGRIEELVDDCNFNEVKTEALVDYLKYEVNLAVQTRKLLDNFSTYLDDEILVDTLQRLLDDRRDYSKLRNSIPLQNVPFFFAEMAFELEFYTNQRNPKVKIVEGYEKKITEYKKANQEEIRYWQRRLEEANSEKEKELLKKELMKVG